MIPTLFDLRTGKTAKGVDMSVYWWTEGNGACDCNRVQVFGEAVAEQLYAGMRRVRPDLKPWQGVCYGCKRFIAIDVEGDLEGFTREEVLATINSEYGT